MSFIHLRHYHTDSAHIDHPLLDDATAHTSDKLDCMAAVAIHDPSRGDELIMALRSSLRHMVGRFVANWPDSKPYVDDMVSEGILAITALVKDLSLDLLAGRAILKVASQRAQNAIEVMLNKRHLAAPGTTTQNKLIKNEEDPIYLKAEGTLEDIERPPTDEGDEWKRDYLEGLDRLIPEDHIDMALLDRFNWGRTEQELADELGVNQQLINYRKKRLYQQFLEITE